MKKQTKLEALQQERDCDTEWLAKYKKIVDGLQQIAEINIDVCNDSFDDWTAISCGLAMVSKLMQEDIDSRKEEK